MMNTIFRGLYITAMAATTLSISADPPHLEQPISAIMQGTTANASGILVADVEVSCWWFDAPMFEPPAFTRGGETRSGADGRFALMCPHPMRAIDPSVPLGMVLGFMNLDPPLKAGEHRELGDIPIEVARFPEQPMTVIDVPVSAMKGHS